MADIQRRAGPLVLELVLSDRWPLACHDPAQEVVLAGDVALLVVDGEGVSSVRVEGLQPHPRAKKRVREEPADFGPLPSDAEPDATAGRDVVLVAFFSPAPHVPKECEWSSMVRHARFTRRFRI